MPCPARLTAALLLALALAGCGTPGQPLPMAIGTADTLQIRGWVPEVLKAQVGLAPVPEAQETGRWWGARLQAAALAQALDESLYGVGMKPPAPQPAPRFELRAELVQLEQPVVSLIGVTVTLGVRYTLADLASDGRIIYQRVISTQEEAGVGDAPLSPYERARIATERALRSNIDRLLRELVTLRP